jgi:hypothetical protein
MTPNRILQNYQLKSPKTILHIFLYLNLLTSNFLLKNKMLFDSDYFTPVIRLPPAHGLNIQEL